jgi:hypothetical protein
LHTSVEAVSIYYTAYRSHASAMPRSPRLWQISRPNPGFAADMACGRQMFSLTEDISDYRGADQNEEH